MIQDHVPSFFLLSWYVTPPPAKMMLGSVLEIAISKPSIAGRVNVSSRYSMLTSFCVDHSSIAACRSNCSQLCPPSVLRSSEVEMHWKMQKLVKLK